VPASDGRMKGLVSGMNGRAPSGSYGSVRFSLVVSKPARAGDAGHLMVSIMLRCHMQEWLSARQHSRAPATMLHPIFRAFASQDAKTSQK